MPSTNHYNIFFGSVLSSLLLCLNDTTYIHIVYTNIRKPLVYFFSTSTTQYNIDFFFLYSLHVWLSSVLRFGWGEIR